MKKSILKSVASICVLGTMIANSCMTANAASLPEENFERFGSCVENATTIDLDEPGMNPGDVLPENCDVLIEVEPEAYIEIPKYIHAKFESSVTREEVETVMDFSVIFGGDLYYDEAYKIEVQDTITLIDSHGKKPITTDVVFGDKIHNPGEANSTIYDCQRVFDSADGRLDFSQSGIIELPAGEWSGTLNFLITKIGDYEPVDSPYY